MARRHLCSLTQRYQGAENREDLADGKGTMGDCDATRQAQGAQQASAPKWSTRFGSSNVSLAL